MKRTILLGLITTFLLTACTDNKQETVQELLKATSSFDKEKASQLLADNFVFSDKSGTHNDKTSFLNRLDTLKDLGTTSKIISIQDLDTIIKTEERVVSFIDSILEISPQIVQRKTYKVNDGKISSILVDTTLNSADYRKSLNEKIQPFAFWAEDAHDVEDQQEVMQNLKKYLTEYSQLSVSDKKKYKMYSRLQGTYVSNDNPFYRKLVFKGKTTVVIIDAIIGFSFPSSYVLDESFVRIRTDKSDLLLEIKDNNTLVGEGFVSGTFKKVN